MSGSDSESLLSSEEDSPIRRPAADLLNVRPTLTKRSKNKTKTVALRAKLNKCRSAMPAKGSRKNCRGKQLEDLFKALINDLRTLIRKFEKVLDCFSENLNSIDSLECRLNSLESSARASNVRSIESLESRRRTLETSAPPSNVHHSYAGVVQTQPDDQRLGKLEYRASKDEKQKKVFGSEAHTSGYQLRRQSPRDNSVLLRFLTEGTNNSFLLHGKVYIYARILMMVPPMVCSNLTILLCTITPFSRI